jgi:phosphatidate cytidylyltransferase
MIWALPPTNVLWALAGVFGLLLGASGIVYTLSWVNPAKDYTELIQRMESWWVIVAMFAVALLSCEVSLIFFAFVSFLALKEYLSLIPTRRVDRQVLLWAYFAIVAQYYWIYINWYIMALIFVPVYMFLFLPMRMVILGETQGFLKAVGTLQWGLMLTLFSLSHLAYLLMLPASNNSAAGSVGLLVYVVFLTEMNDIAQYIFGKCIGRHKLIPNVSPNKTWEGFLGGFFTTVLMSIVCAPWLTPFSSIHALAAGMLIGLTGFIGDITVSALKRDLGVKDSSQLIPGHGGILDRIDSLTYTAPLFFHFTAYFYFHGWIGTLQ